MKIKDSNQNIWNTQWFLINIYEKNNGFQSKYMRINDFQSTYTKTTMCLINIYETTTNLNQHKWKSIVYEQ